MTVSGNLYGENPALPVFTPTLGAFNVLITRSVSSLTQTVATGSGPTPSEIATAVRSSLESGTPIPVNVEQVNNRQLKGTGVSGDSWGPT